jgi:tetratricopeptide (TPR) repeat protein
MITRKKKMLFSLIPILFLSLILVLVEFSLRFFCASLANPLVITAVNDGVEWYQINRGSLAKYFPSDNVIVPEMKPSLFKKHKGRNLFRIMCLGESSMLGTPYQMNANIPSILRKQLRHLYPDTEFEVLNLGAAAINSNVILVLAEEMAEYQPDLILIYTGHNEFYGPDGIDASLLEKQFPFLIQVKYRLRDLRTVAWVQKTMRKIAAGSASGERNLMKEVSRNNAVALKSREAEWVFQQFEKNLCKIIELCKSRNIPLIVSDVTSNLTFPPFAYDTLGGIRNWRQEFAAIESTFDKGEYQRAQASLLRLYELDSTNAFINFWLGKTCLALNKPDSAVHYFVRARDNDFLKFRSPERTNQIIRTLTNRESVPFISADSLFRALSDNGIAGRELFWEHLHPTARGYYEIANLFLKKILELRIVPHSAGSITMTNAIPFNTDSLSICWLELAFGDIAMRNLTKHWPFDNYESRTYVIEAADSALQQIAFDLYSSKLAWSDGCLRSALYFQHRGRYRDAATTYEALLEEYPTNFYSHYMLGFVYKEMGELTKATEHYTASIKNNAQYPYPRIDLGLIQINVGNYDEAIDNFTVALQFTEGQNFSSERATIYYGLSAAFANKGEIPRALSYIDESLKLSPTYQPARVLRSNLLRYK